MCRSICCLKDVFRELVKLVSLSWGNLVWRYVRFLVDFGRERYMLLSLDFGGWKGSFRGSVGWRGSFGF